MERPNDNIKIIGLTGGIGSGKTVATDALVKAGYSVIDADVVSRTLFARDSAGETALMSIFPNAVSDGHLNRAELRKIIAANASEREKLNAATHPAVLAEIHRLLHSATSTTILSAPLLFESGLDAFCDVTVCISCPLVDRVKRIMLRDGIDETDARAIIATQLTDAERERSSNIVISSDGTPEQFAENVLNVFSNIIKDYLT